MNKIYNYPCASMYQQMSPELSLKSPKSPKSPEFSPCDYQDDSPDYSTDNSSGNSSGKYTRLNGLAINLSYEEEGIREDNTSDSEFTAKPAKVCFINKFDCEKDIEEIIELMKNTLGEDIEWPIHNTDYDSEIYYNNYFSKSQIYFNIQIINCKRIVEIKKLSGNKDDFDLIFMQIKNAVLYESGSSSSSSSYEVPSTPISETRDTYTSVPNAPAKLSRKKSVFPMTSENYVVPSTPISTIRKNIVPDAPKAPKLPRTISVFPGTCVFSMTSEIVVSSTPISETRGTSGLSGLSALSSLSAPSAPTKLPRPISEISNVTILGKRKFCDLFAEVYKSVLKDMTDSDSEDLDESDEEFYRELREIRRKY